MLIDRNGQFIKSTIGIEFAWNIDDSVSWKATCGRTKWAWSWSHCCCTRKAIFIYLFFCVKVLIQLYFLSHSLTHSSLAHSCKWIKLRDLFFMCTWLVSSYLFLATRDILFIKCNSKKFTHTLFGSRTIFVDFIAFSLIIWRVLQLYLI